MRLADLAGIEENDRTRECHASLDTNAPADYRELAALLACSWGTKRPGVVGISGGQGAGKTTLARLIVSAGEQVGLRIGVVSLDDFYLGKAEREKLAERVHPLLETRGPPGSHDMVRCGASLYALRCPGEIQLPVFDKGLDDRTGFRIVTGPFDLVLLEGWCVGARAVSDVELETPINALEVEQDPARVWRRYTNEALVGDYAPVWEALDTIVYLRVPSLDAVRRWRQGQEQGRQAERQMQGEEIDRFVQHYERLTLSMLADLPPRSDWLVTLDEAHGIADLSIRRD